MKKTSEKCREFSLGKLQIFPEERNAQVEIFSRSQEIEHSWQILLPSRYYKKHIP